MSSEETPGARLKAYIEANWGRKRGGMEQLAQEAGLRGRQTLYEWFAGSEPSLPSLGQVADVLGVRRVDLVAAYDGVTAPEQQDAPLPRWAAEMEDRLRREIQLNRALIESEPDAEVEQLRAALHGPGQSAQPPAEEHPMEGERPPGSARHSVR